MLLNVYPLNLVSYCLLSVCVAFKRSLLSCSQSSNRVNTCDKCWHYEHGFAVSCWAVWDAQVRFLCASPRGDDASFPLNQPQLNINIQPGALNTTSPSHHHSDPAASSAHISSPSPCSNMHLVSCVFIPISAAETSNHSQCRQCRHVDHRTYCEHIYLTGRHRQKWLCVGIISQPCSPHLTGTDQLLSIWPLGDYTPSVLEGDITTAPNGL